MSRLEGKVAVITGAGSGIGMATSRLFLEMGCKVICSDISDQFLSELENEISSYKPNYVILERFRILFAKSEHFLNGSGPNQVPNILLQWAKLEAGPK